MENAKVAAEIVATAVEAAKVAAKTAAELAASTIAKAVAAAEAVEAAAIEVAAINARVMKEIESAAQYTRSLIEASLDPLVTISTEGKITDVNAATIKVTGSTREALIGSDFADYFTDPQKAREGYQKAFLNGSLAIRHTSGGITDVIYNASVYCNVNGEVQGLFAAARDVTERKKAELELEQSRNNLEQLVETRTNALSIAKAATEKANVANIAKSKFIATMSHELRTPLNAILGFSELMSLDTTATEKQKETLRIINRSGLHLLSMINDVLDISKIESGRLELDIQAFNLPTFLNDIAVMINVRAKAKKLNFRVELAPDIARFIKTDSGKLRQILINLLDNPIKFTAKGAVILRACTSPLVDKILLSIDVLDSGVGISTDNLAELFQPFVQVMQANSDTQGTGLGLSIAKSLVQLMGGRISVSSELGAGSTFTIELPVELADAADVGVSDNVGTVKSLAPNQPTWRLLIVDDSADNRLLMSSMLKDLDFQVHEAENGLEAIREFQEWQPHLIWMDMRMPVMDGHVATAKIRQLDGGDKVKIIALTASVFQEQHQHIIEEGCDAVLLKPFHVNEILTALVKYLGVKFIYEDTLTSAAPITEITAEMLRQLPAGLLLKLHTAALLLDTNNVDITIESIRSIAPAIAERLDKLAQNYHFDQITQLIDAIEPLELVA